MVSIELTRRVRWADSDPAGILYYPRIFDYCSDAEVELMRRVGFARQSYHFPRVHAECDFKKVLTLGTPFTFRLSVARLGRTSIRFDFQVFREGEPDDPAAEGHVVAVIMKNGQPVDIPNELRTALGAEEMLETM